MKTTPKHKGFTLTEQLIVIAGVVILAAIAIPSAKTFLKSFESTDAAKTIIDAALKSARAMAINSHQYTGIRFQIEGYPQDRDSLLQANQYIIFVNYNDSIQENSESIDYYKAVRNIEPIKIPRLAGVMDLRHRLILNDHNRPEYIDINLSNDPDSEFADLWQLRDTTSFTILFSPEGKLVVKNCKMRNRDCFDNNDSYDDMFNTIVRMIGFLHTIQKSVKNGQFVQDDYAPFGLGREPSRRGFVVYEKEKLKEALNAGKAYSEYLEDLEAAFINTYTGTIIN